MTEDALRQDYRDTFTTPAGQRVLRDLAGFASRAVKPSVRAGRYDMVSAMLLKSSADVAPMTIKTEPDNG